MCAITGWLAAAGVGVSPQVVRRMATALAHRGPDDSGEFADVPNGIALAHRRLSIIDLSAASHQPMADAANSVVLAYNGELYNFRELRADLQALGHTFISAGDTEVVLRSYLQWGAACFERLAGMFAIAIWDPRSATLHLARDAMGMKPLYYRAGAHGLQFASELKAFREVPGFEAAADPHALRQFIEFGYVFDERRTMFEGVLKLEPGHRLEVRDGRISKHAAWFVPPASVRDGRGEAERVDELGTMLERVVEQHLIADVDTALLLSGGLDSSVLAALAARKGPLLTISMNFADSEVDERPFARTVSGFIGSRHVEVTIDPSEVEREVEGGAWVFDDLFADWGTITTRLLYRRCRERGVKVVLVGEGSDELFGGYDKFEFTRLGLWQQFRLYQRYSGRRHGKLFGDFYRCMAGYLAASGGDAFDAVRLFESRRQLPNNYVMKVDKASMAESVEARTPYLDRRIAEIAYRTPSEWLVRGGQSKYLLRALARSWRLLPESVSARPKFGASIATGWMAAHPGFRRFARERLVDGAWCERLGLRGAMRSFFDEGRSGARFPGALSIYSNVAWRMLLLELWSSHYLAR